MAIESIDQLRVFVQVVESGNLTAAARALGVSVNTISRRLTALEAATGARLLHRTTRSNSLSDEGHELYQRAVRILAEVDAADRSLGSERGELHGVLRMAVPTLVVGRDMLERLATALDEHPQLSVQLRVTDQAPHPITEGLDLTVQAGELPDSSLYAKRLAAFGAPLAVSTAYAAAHGVPQTPAELSDHQCLRFMSRSPQARWTMVDDDGVEVSVPISGRFESDDSRTLREALSVGLGVGPVGWGDLQRGVASGELVRAVPTHTLPPMGMFLVSPVAGRKSLKVRAMSQLLTELFASSLWTATDAP